jgi:voltage-gated potassium channel
VTTGSTFDTLASRQRRRLIIAVALRTLATSAVLVTLFYILPLDRKTNATILAELVGGLTLVVAVLLVQVRSITNHEYPNIRAIEALAFTIPFYLLIFATAYFLMTRAEPTSFTEVLTRTDALYFTVSVFTTVGFGDIAAKGEAARLVVTAQMLLDLLVVGLVLRVVFNAVKRGQERHRLQGEEREPLGQNEP